MLGVLLRKIDSTFLAYVRSVSAILLTALLSEKGEMRAVEQTFHDLNEIAILNMRNHDKLARWDIKPLPARKLRGGVGWAQKYPS